ncbi:MAG: polymer-forming cytoskeletal protein [Bacteriovoracaceae bacterium]
MENIVDIQEKNFSYISKNSVIKGDITLSGTTHLYGKIQGKIFQTSSTDVLIIEPSGQIDGEVESTGSIIVYGKLAGNVICKNRFVCEPDSLVEGEIRSENLVIYPGARVNSEFHSL